MMSCRLTHSWVARLRVLAGAGVCITLASGCGGGDGGSPAAPVATVVVTPNPVELEVDSTVQLTATLEDADGNTLSGRTVTWSSDAALAATVDGNGVVTGVAPGPANITAASEGNSGTAALTIIPSSPPPSSSKVLVGPGGKEPSTSISRWHRDDREWDAIGDLVRGVGPVTAARMFFGGPSSVRGPPGSANLSAPGDRVLFAGGDGAGNVVAIRDAVVFDPATDESTGLDMTAARIYHTMTPLSGSRALLAGGDSGIIAGPGTIRR
jgi:hypothetical protein